MNQNQEIVESFLNGNHSWCREQLSTMDIEDKESFISDLFTLFSNGYLNVRQLQSLILICL